MKLHATTQTRAASTARGETSAAALALLLVLSLANGCGEKAPARAANETAPPAAAEASTPGPGEAHAAASPGAQPAPPVSDLDQPLETLLAATCEHAVKTYECPECRYQTGFVLASKQLFEGGLLHTVAVGRERVQVPLPLTGEVRFDERRVTHVSTQVEGIIRQTSVALGDRVKAGQPLLEIESVDVGEAEGTYLEAQAVQRLATRNFERLSALRDKAIASEKEYLLAQQEREAAEIRTEAALGRLTRLGMSPADAAALRPASALGRLVLRAPSGGTVLALHAVPGEVAKSDEALATIGNNATVWVWADVYEGDIERIARELRAHPLEATVTVKAYPGVAFPGTVDFMSPLMEESSRTVKLRVEVENEAGRLLSGMFANVEILLPGADEALVVPRSAVLDDEGRAFVFVHHHGDYFVRRPVVVGREWGERAEVLGGLVRGQMTVADGAFLLKSDVLRSKMGAGCAD